MPDFPDTIIVPRRREPMDFRPASYEAAHAASELDDEDSEFGALEGLTRGSGYIAAAWAIIAATAVAAYLIWW